MDIGDISSLMNIAKSNVQSVDSSKLQESIKNKDFKAATDDELMDVCKEFEAYFIEQVFKNMKKSMVPASQPLDGASETLKSYYEDELTSQYAKSAAEQSTSGLAQMLYEQMKRNYGSVSVEEIEKAKEAEAAKNTETSNVETGEETVEKI